MRIVKRPHFYLLALIMIAHETPAATISLAGSPETDDRLGSSVAVGDLNCDGFDDLAAGVPTEDVDGVSNAGVVNIVYGGAGSSGQLGGAGNFYLRAGGTPEVNDAFGDVLAAGDFNRDGCDDLAVGMPNKTISGQANAGQVMVLFGNTSGPGTVRQIWHQNTSGVHGGPESGDQFGSSLAVGDFDGDSLDDLAIGVVGENSWAGGVHVLHGRPSGLTATGALYFDQNTAGVPSDRFDLEEFGWALASGDFNGDGYGDLAVGVPSEFLENSSPKAGAVHVLYGSSSSLSVSGTQLWHQNSSGIPGDASANERFGASLAAGDFNGDGRDDLAIGTPRDGYPAPGGVIIIGYFGYGSVLVLNGTTAGLSGADNKVWSGGNRLSWPSDNGMFGAFVTAGDFNGDGYADLAIGAPESDATSAIDKSGAVQVLYGHATDMGQLAQYIDQNVSGVDDTVEASDFFGRSLSTGDFNNDGLVDLAVGIPEEELTAGISNSGAVQVFYGTAGTLDLANDQLFVQ